MKFGITPNVHEFLKIVVGEFEKLDTRINELNRQYQLFEYSTTTLIRTNGLKLKFGGLNSMKNTALVIFEAIYHLGIN